MEILTVTRQTGGQNLLATVRLLGRAVTQKKTEHQALFKDNSNRFHRIKSNGQFLILRSAILRVYNKTIFTREVLDK